jgi:hypothetical protein
MKKYLYILPIIILCLVTCRERTNIYDICDEDFVAPPHIWAAWVSVVYYNANGLLCGVRMQIDFTDPFEKNLPIYHQFYEGTSLRTEIEYTANTGTKVYSVEIFGPYTVGEYYLKIFFGEIPIGACYFEVIDNDGVLEIENISQRLFTPQTPESWYGEIVN